MERYVCIHGHFYQPVRDNPWLEAIETQDSAYPYHDWNQRITAECYAPNAAARILGSKGKITRIVSNYSKISFNFGPTLLAWMRNNAPEVYQSILDADKQSQHNFGGHGSAMAQCYNHIIMPLADRRDKQTQVLWGIRDFEKHFGRKPRGMWLPETAVDLETLDLMAENSINFTILATRQARQTRAIGLEAWEDTNGKIDTTMPYRLALPSGRSIAIFFYNDAISHAVAFEGLLRDGEQFAKRLTDGPETDKPALIHIATDGETYGHHHRFGEMALAYALQYIESNKLARLTNYSQYLELHPPTHEVEINENTSWSCSHGVERWRSDCGDNGGRRPGFNQAWRGPLREAFDWLRDALAPKFEEKASGLLKDPWAARNDYIDVVFERSPEVIRQFTGKHARRALNHDEEVVVLKLMELQRAAMLMYSSDGWFFDEISDIETVQVMKYAGRALQLGRELFGDGIEPRFLELLERSKSNIAEQGDGRLIFEKYVRPDMIDLKTVGAHFAITSLFEDYSERAKVYCYDIKIQDYRSFVAGRSRLAVGIAGVTSAITGESDTLDFGALHFGDHNLTAGIHEYREQREHHAVLNELSLAFSRTDFPEVIRLFGRHFGPATYSVRSLFGDEQRKITGRLLETTGSEIEAAYRQIYERHHADMRYILDMGNPVPEEFRSAAMLILNLDIRRAARSGSLDTARLLDLYNEARAWKIDLDGEGISFELRQTIDKMMADLASKPDNLGLLKKLVDALTLLKTLPFEINLWQAQNLYYRLLGTVYPEFQKRTKSDKTIQEWLTQFVLLGEQLYIEVPVFS